MIKKILKTLIIVSILLFSITTIKIGNNNEFKLKKQSTNQNELGQLTIKKLNLENTIYKKGTKENNVEKNITILNESILPDNENSIIFLAAHSGTGKIAYFNKLNKLKKNDEIKLKIKNKEYKYLVSSHWEEKKNGYINVNKEKEKQLILTTCSPNKKGYQLIVNCIEKKS